MEKYSEEQKQQFQAEFKKRAQKFNRYYFISAAMIIIFVALGSLASLIAPAFLSNPVYFAFIAAYFILMAYFYIKGLQTFRCPACNHSLNPTLAKVDFSQELTPSTLKYCPRCGIRLQ